MSDHLDKPVHKILEDYDLLDVSVIQNQYSINMSAGILWRLNLCATSNEIPCTFFVAMNYRVQVYTLDTIDSPFKDPVQTLASPNAQRIGGGSESPYVINAIKVGRMLEKEVLITVSEIGEVCIWRTQYLKEPPMILSNNVSTWGIAIHADQGLLAVSANSWRITIFNLLEMTKDNPIFGSKKKPNLLGATEKIELEGHEHNIPNIDFSESGRYIASASVDTTCRVWDITTHKMITQKRFPIVKNQEENAWCWSVKFIKPGYFKYSICCDKDISKLYSHRIYQGRSSSLSNLGLRHSASTPAFPINVSRVFDLDDEDIEFEVYEGEEEGSGDSIDDTMWDNALLDDENDFMEQIFEQQRQEDDYDYNHDPISRTASGLEENSDSSQEEETLQSTRRQLVNQRTESDWATTITDVSEPNRDGWGDETHNGQYNFDLQNILQQRFNTNNEDIPSFIDHTAGGDGLNDGHKSNIPELDTETISQDDQDDTPPSHCIPKIIRSTTKQSGSSSSSSNLAATLSNNNNNNDNDRLGEYLMVSTGKDLTLLSTTIPKMNRIRAEHDMIKKVDVRSDQLLSVLDRISMVEWLPELELFVAASQKGTVALMRILQVEFEGGQQACIFNNEAYLPSNVLQSTPLYGMTVKKVESERFQPICYQIFLFYYSGNVLGYRVSRKDADILVDSLIF